MRSDPYDVVRAITIARATLRKMHQNLAWAVGYNVVAFPIAAGVFYPQLPDRQLPTHKSFGLELP